MSDPAQNPPDNIPRITAGVYYRDSASGLDFLGKGLDINEPITLTLQTNGTIMSKVLENSVLKNK
jgi:hypothetical protein